MNSNFPSEIIINGREMRAKDRDLMWLKYHLKSKVRYHLGLALEKEKEKCHPQNEPTFPEASLVTGAHWRAGGCLLALMSTSLFHPSPQQDRSSAVTLQATYPPRVRLALLEARTDKNLCQKGRHQTFYIFCFGRFFVLSSICRNVCSRSAYAGSHQLLFTCIKPCLFSNFTVMLLENASLEKSLASTFTLQPNHSL